MKKFISIVMTLAMVGSFMPTAYAGDSATLGLQVAFDTFGQVPVWKIEPHDANVIQGKTVKVELLAEDPDGGVISYGCIWSLNGVEQPRMTLPEGAVFTWKMAFPGPTFLPQNPNLTWNVPYSINPDDIHEFLFIATKGNPDNPEEPSASLYKKIRITVEQAVISVELTPATWSLSGVKLGDIKENKDSAGAIMHSIKNAGNVPIVVEMGYVPMIATDLNSIHPGLEQGVDTFTTLVKGAILPPKGRIELTSNLPPDDTANNLSYGMLLPLAFGAPTNISNTSVKNLSVSYEIRAYSAPYERYQSIDV